MNNPQYILLTIVNIIAPDPRKPGLANITVVQPPVKKLYPLPLQFTCEQGAAPDRARAEIELGQLIFRCEELFYDVVDAIEMAGAADDTVVRVANRERIAGASAKAVLDPAFGQVAERAMQAAEEAEEAGAIRWDEAMRFKDADFAGRKPEAGDLRIVPSSDVWIFQARNLMQPEGDGFEWTRDSIPSELRSEYGSAEAARAAAKIAGFARKLVDA